MEGEEEAMPSTLSKYRKELRKHEKRVRAKELLKGVGGSSTTSTTTSKQWLGKDVDDQLQEAERRLKEFLRGSDEASTTDRSAVFPVHSYFYEAVTIKPI